MSKNRRDTLNAFGGCETEGDFFKIPNFKENRIQKVDNNYSYTPITADLAELLLHFGVTGENDYVVVPEHWSRYS